MAFTDQVSKSGKGLDKTKNLVVALEVNLGGTCGTQYLADKNVTVEGTYYDGRLTSASSVNRRIFPDVGSYEISGLDVELANQDSEFYNPKWIRWINGKSARLRIAFEGTRDLVQSDFTTRYNGIIQDAQYNSENDIFRINLEDKTQNLLLKYIPDHTLDENGFPGADTELNPIGTPLPYVFGHYDEVIPSGLELKGNYSESIPGVVIGTHTAGTSEMLFADHASDAWYVNQFLNGVEFHGTQGVDFTYFTNGTITSYGTRSVTYVHWTGDVGTHQFSTQMAGTTKRQSEVVQYMLEKAGLSHPDDFGTFSFERVLAAEEGTYVYQYSHAYLFSPKTIKEHLDKICFERNYKLFFDAEGKANLKFTKYSMHPEYSSYYPGFPPPTANPYFADGDEESGTKILDETDFLDFQAYKDASHVANDVQMVYHYSPTYGVYRYYGQVEHKVSQKRLGYTKTLKLESDWLYGTQAHYQIAQMKLGRFRYPIYKAKFTTPMSVLPLDLGDYIAVTHSKAPNEYGTQGWNEKQMEIVNIEEDYNNNTVECEAWEWQLQIPSWRLHGWFSLAEGEGTSCNLEWTDRWYDDYEANSQHRFSMNKGYGTELLWVEQFNGDYVAFFDGTSSFLTNYGTGWDLDLEPGGVVGAFVKPYKAGGLAPADLKPCIASAGVWGTNGWAFGIGTAESLYFGFYQQHMNQWVLKETAASVVDMGTFQALHVGINKVNLTGNSNDMAVYFYVNGTQQGTVQYVVGTGVIESPTGYGGIGAANVGTWTTGTLFDPGTNTSGDWLGTVSGFHYLRGWVGDAVFYKHTGTLSAANMTKLFNGLRGRYGL